MELTYEEYIDLGGICEERMYPRLKADAEADLASLMASFTVVWNTSAAQKLALVSLIDRSVATLQTMQSGDSVSSIHVGSYSETRSTGDGGAVGLTGPAYSIVSRYARIYRKPVGVVL